MNGYNFTERVRLALQRAREEATALQHEYVGTEHMLLGLLRSGNGVAWAVFEDAGLSEGRIREALMSVVQRGTRPTPGPDLPYTSRAKKSLEHAMREARELRHSYVGTEHVLLGILRERANIAAQVLNSLGLTEASVRANVLRMLAGPVAERGEQLSERQILITITIEREQGPPEKRTFADPQAAAEYLRRLET